ncbi:hypothetical protein D3C78_913890 [compost metagenome]
MRLNRHRAAAQSCSATALFSPAERRWRHRDPPAPRRCSLSPPLPIQDDPAAYSSSSSSAAVRRLYRLLCDTFRADGGKSRPEFRRRSALHPAHPGLSSATVTSARSWQSSRLLLQSRSTADGTLRSESTPYPHRSSRRGSARSSTFQ